MARLLTSKSMSCGSLGWDRTKRMREFLGTSTTAQFTLATTGTKSWVWSRSSATRMAPGPARNRHASRHPRTHSRGMTVESQRIFQMPSTTAPANRHWRKLDTKEHTAISAAKVPSISPSSGGQGIPMILAPMAPLKRFIEKCQVMPLKTLFRTSR